MLGWMNRLYGKLPLVREIREIKMTLARQAAVVERALVESFVLSLIGQERYRDARRLAHSEHQVYSQNGEDGIIAEVFRRVGTSSRAFVEVGVGEGSECNTAFLLSQGWRGCWVEGNPKSAHTIRAHFEPYLREGSLQLIELFVTRENIAPALKTVGLAGEIDLLSVDVDRNTYWIWEALGAIRARVVVVEYNATYPPSIDWTIGYAADQWWDGSFEFGASLKAYELLGRRLGYSLVGCDITGTNAFFVRDDLVGESFVAPFTAENHYEPPRYWLVRPPGHRRPARPQPPSAGP
jgi:hypothetical protein